jgi:hypothetical protein
MDDRGVSGERVTSADVPSRRWRAGRVCQEKGCSTRLSIYNDADRCSLHAPMAVPRTRGTKIA